ncbi:Cdc6/Cdc18 family protein [Halostella litorea]|uniref:Cdc6/Cdc18 family protein n=1 Tax=Halostella litorea TaxID=2528831 RepID=UPI0013875164|nr:AAA family ATPase [Halostella litorea]
MFDEAYVPQIVGRRTEKKALASVLDPITDGERATDTVLFGGTGTGKTATTRYMLANLDENSLADFKTAYVSCINATDRRSILRGVAEELPINSSALDAESASGLVRRIKNRVNEPFVVVIDEVDTLEPSEYNVLHNLYGINWVSLILIVNDRDTFLGGLDGIYESRFEGSREIHFEPYSDRELYRIIEARQEAGLAEGAINERALRTIAVAASNARVAVTYLETTADEVQSPPITAEDVAEAKEEVYETLRKHAIERLPERHGRVFEIIEADGPIGSREVRQRYAEAFGEELSRGQFTRAVAKLKEYESVVAEGATSGTVYRATEVPGGVPEIA